MTDLKQLAEANEANIAAGQYVSATGPMGLDPVGWTRVYAAGDSVADCLIKAFS